jgi:hypothetical protein
MNNDNTLRSKTKATIDICTVCNKTYSQGWSVEGDARLGHVVAVGPRLEQMAHRPFVALHSDKIMHRKGVDVSKIAMGSRETIGELEDDGEPELREKIWEKHTIKD